MMALIDMMAGVSSDDRRHDDDFTDRLSNKYSVLMCLTGCLIVSASLFVNDPINCWSPSHFSGSHTNYAQAYCWVRNTYYLEFDEEIPQEHESDKRRTIPYYQWIPFILVAQAALFYLPSVVWHAYNQRAGVDADTILNTAKSMSDVAGDTEAFSEKLKIIHHQVDRFLMSRASSGPSYARPMQRRAKYNMAVHSSRRFGCYLILLYIFTKILYLANVVAQLFMLNSILAVEYSVYGIEVFRWMLSDYDWTTSPQIAFPRVTMCDFNVRRLGNVHRYTVQCTLPINLYNEKIYMFLWFWMVFVAICTAISLITWILRLAMPRDRTTYIQNHLRMLKKLENDADKEKADSFTTNYLRQDGVFLLRLIGHNTNTLTVSEIIGALWDNWNDRNRGNPNRLTPNAPPALEMKPTTEEEPMLPEKEKEK